MDDIENMVTLYIKCLKLLCTYIKKLLGSLLLLLRRITGRDRFGGMVTFKVGLRGKEKVNRVIINVII